MPFGWTDREKIQAYNDRIRAATPQLKGASDFALADLATRLYEPGTETRMKAMNDAQRKSIADLRKLIPKPEFDYKTLEASANKGSDFWNGIKGLMEGVDPIGVYRPMYSEEDAASGWRTAGNLTGALGTMFVPVAGPAAKLVQLSRIPKLLKAEKAAETLAKVVGRGVPMAVDALQAQSQYNADRKQLGLDYEPGTGLSLMALGGAMSGMGAAGQGVNSLRGKLMRGLPAPIMADAQMGTSPYIANSAAFKDTTAALRYPKAIAMALGRAEGPMDVAETLSGLAIPAAMGGFAAKRVGAKAPLPRFGDFSAEAPPNISREAAFAPPTAGANAAPTAPAPARTISEVTDSNPGEFQWDPSVADTVHRGSSLYNVQKALQEARMAEGGAKANLVDPQTGERMMLVSPMGGNSVIVGRSGERPMAMGIETARQMPKDVVVPVGTREGTKVALAPGFMPGSKEGDYQFRSFMHTDDQGNRHQALVVGNNTETGEIIILHTDTGKKYIGHKSLFPEAKPIWEVPKGPSEAELIEKGKRSEQLRRSTAAPYKITTPEDAIATWENVKRQVGIR